MGRNAERGDKTVAEIRAVGGKADFIPSDLRYASRAREVSPEQGPYLFREDPQEERGISLFSAHNATLQS